MSKAPVYEPYTDYQPEGDLEKFTRKIKEDPFVPIGMTGFLGVLAYGAYKYKHRGNMSTSMYLMQLRVASQGTVVGCLCIGLIYSMSKEYLFKKTDVPALKDSTNATESKY